MESHSLSNHVKNEENCFWARGCITVSQKVDAVQACSVWTAADIPVSSYTGLKKQGRMFALEPKSQLRFWLPVKMKEQSLVEK